PPWRAAFGELRREPLVVHLHGHLAEPRGQGASELARLSGLLGVATVEPEGQTHEDELDASLVDQLADRAQAAPGARPGDERQRRGDRASSVAEGASAASAAVDEREHAHQLPSADAIAARAASRA